MLINRKAILLTLFIGILLTITTATAQDNAALEGLGRGFGTVSGVLLALFTYAQQPAMLVVIARILAFLIIYSASEAGGRFAGKGAGKGLTNAVRVFGLVVALATQVLASNGFMLAFMFVAAALGQIVLLGVTFYAVYNGIKGEGEESKARKGIAAIVMLFLGMLFISVNLIPQNTIDSLIQNGYVEDGVAVDLIQTMPSYLTVINLIPIGWGAYELAGLFVGTGLITGFTGASVAGAKKGKNKKKAEKLTQAQKDALDNFTNTANNPASTEQQIKDAYLAYIIQLKKGIVPLEEARKLFEKRIQELQQAGGNP